MTTDAVRIRVSGIAVDVVRKNIKNLHLGVYPPHGRVRVAAPPTVSDEAVRLAVIDKLAWIKRQRSRFSEQPRQSQREMVNGESHYFLGRRYRLRVHERDGPPEVMMRGIAALDLLVPRGSNPMQREATLTRWHRKELKALIPPILDKWQRKLGVKASAWGVRRMKTKWGSCNVDSARLSFNLELVKKPPQCLEYIVAHELIHLLERHHNERFIALLNKHVPHWREARALLNSAPLAHESWTY